MANEQDNLPPQEGAAYPNPQNMINFNELKTIYSIPKAEIPLFYGDNTNHSVTAKFMYYNCILIAQT